MMNRRTFLCGLTLGTLSVPLAGEGQQAQRVPRIGFLGGSPTRAPLETFREALRDLGYVEGQSITINWRYWEGRPERLPDLAAELVGLKPDLIVAAGAAPALATKRATATIPIVFVGVGGDPVALGLVPNLARPGGNVTGLVLFSFELAGKQFELLKEALPRLTRLAVLINPTNPNVSYWKGAEAAAYALGLKRQYVEARELNDFERAFAEMRRERAEALFVMADPFFFLERKRLAQLAVRSRLPAMFWLKEQAEAGGLMSYGASRNEHYRRAAYFVDKILKGAKLADLPVEQPTKFELIINLKTAKTLGLSIPLLLRADQLLE